MAKKSTLVLKVLTNHYHSKDAEEFSQHLSESTRLSLNEIVLVNAEIAPLIQKNLSDIHYSWIAPCLKKFSKDEAAMACLCFELSQRKGLLEMLEIKPPSKKLSPVAREYYLKKIAEAVIDPHILPKEYLETSPLTPLLDLNKAYLVEVVDLLGVHDLGEKIRAIVDKTKLRAIYKGLTPVQLKYLEFVLRQTERTSLTDLDLKQWEGNYQNLGGALHKKGLLRLAKALSTESLGFLWHIMHKFDTGRAEFLKKNMQMPAGGEVVQLLKNQLISIVNLISHKKEA